MTRRTLNGFQPSAFQNDAFQMADRVAGSGGARIPFWHSMLRGLLAEQKRKRKREQEQEQEVETTVALDHPQTIPLRFSYVYVPPTATTLAKLRASTAAADLAAFTKFMEALAELDEEEYT